MCYSVKVVSQTLNNPKADSTIMERTSKSLPSSVGDSTVAMTSNSDQNEIVADVSVTTKEKLTHFLWIALTTLSVILLYNVRSQ
jgi:hypothetical protein